MVTYLYNWKTTITTGSSAFLIQDHLRRLVAGVAAPRAPRARHLFAGVSSLDSNTFSFN